MSGPHNDYADTVEDPDTAEDADTSPDGDSDTDPPADVQDVGIYEVRRGDIAVGTPSSAPERVHAFRGVSKAISSALSDPVPCGSQVSGRVKIRDAGDHEGA